MLFQTWREREREIEKSTDGSGEGSKPASDVTLKAGSAKQAQSGKGLRHEFCSIQTMCVIETGLYLGQPEKDISFKYYYILLHIKDALCDTTLLHYLSQL